MDKSEYTRSGDPEDFATDNLISLHNRINPPDLPLSFLSFSFLGHCCSCHLHNNHLIHVLAYKDSQS